MLVFKNISYDITFYEWDIKLQRTYLDESKNVVILQLYSITSKNLLISIGNTTLYACNHNGLCFP